MLQVIRSHEDADACYSLGSNERIFLFFDPWAGSSMLL